MGQDIRDEGKDFSDEGYGPIPKKFKGQCDSELDPTFKCNRKLIGARFFYKGFAEEIVSANKTFPKKLILRDMQGHGTHTLSIAAGNVVPISGSMLFRFLGLDNATRRGGSSLWPDFITEEEDELGLGTFGTLIHGLEAIEAAIYDGVDIINLSMGLASLEDENHKPMTVKVYCLVADSFWEWESLCLGLLLQGPVGTLLG
ncbi:Subtilisin-like protease SBT5.3, partial [Bienertia sinuspersici]